MKDWDEPVSKRATVMYRNVAPGPLCTLTLVVKDVSSTVMMPPVRLGPCSGNGGANGNGEVLAEQVVAECLFRRATLCCCCFHINSSPQYSSAVRGRTTGSNKSGVEEIPR